MYVKKSTGTKGGCKKMMELTPNFRFTEESHDVIKANLQKKTHYGMFQQSIESHHSTIFLRIFFQNSVSL